MDANAALAALKQRADITDGKTLLGGMSRGGVVAILQAGHSPEAFSGVLNFVGGWVSEGWGDPEINPILFRRIGSFRALSCRSTVKRIPTTASPIQSRTLPRWTHLELITGFTLSRFPAMATVTAAMFVPSLWGNVMDDFLRQVR